MTSTDHIEFLSHHSLLLALPAFLPAVAVAGVVTWIAVRDRRLGDDDDDDPDGSSSNAADSSRQDGEP